MENENDGYWFIYYKDVGSSITMDEIQNGFIWRRADPAGAFAFLTKQDAMEWLEIHDGEKLEEQLQWRTKEKIYCFPTAKYLLYIFRQVGVVPGISVDEENPWYLGTMRPKTKTPKEQVSTKPFRFVIPSYGLGNEAVVTVW